ncbi:hypothetical protein [Arthrospiribacter ruber]|uniref:Uncharacterized protein n=1 Tax=Arthrospiribacter ruber TaxID=2487934 RepID=A0A951IZZ2_9BACT|nr:hypothetical protein [Arthrospiribacter ruber]MBW3470240.1 hypothetical protein [Arthrospiribacter ruber]
MKKIFLLSFMIALTTWSTFAQNNPDSVKIFRLEQEIEVLKNYNESLQQNLEITNKAITDLVIDKNISDETRWTSIKSSIIHSTQIHKKLSDDIINLKSRMTDQEYQGFIKSLGSIEGGPLGFSLEEVIMESAKKIGIFESKTKMDRFLDVTNNILSSPLTSGIPFVSQAFFASNSLVNIAYSSMLTEKKPDFEKLGKFENELNKYLVYFSALDKANTLNQSSNYDRVVLLENLQLELLAKLNKDMAKLGQKMPERIGSETLDAYFNRVLGEFSKENVERHLNQVERKYRSSRGQVNYAALIQNETDLKNYSNQINGTVELAKKFILYYDNFFELADNYQIKVSEALDLAHQNGIIQGKKSNGTVESPQQVYDRISRTLRDKKVVRDNGIKDSINIADLKQKIEKVDEFRFM